MSMLILLIEIISHFLLLIGRSITADEQIYLSDMFLKAILLAHRLGGKSSALYI